MEIRLNLLPEEKKDRYRYERRFARLSFWGGAFLASMAFLLAALYGIGLAVSLEARTRSLEGPDASERESYEEVKRYEQKFSETGSRLDDLDGIAADQLHWSGILAKLSGIVPDGVTVSSLATSDYLINMTGEAESREKLVAFRDALSGNGCFSDVNLPLSDLVEKENIDFQLTFKASEECLKNP